MRSGSDTYAVGDLLRHHAGDLWRVVETGLPGDGQWHGTMVELAGDYRIECIAGREQGRVARVHADYLEDQSGWRREQNFQDPTEGGAATTPVEARGTSSTARDSRRGRNPSFDAARAAGAQLTGQRQDGSSQAPATATQYPAPAHGGRRPTEVARGR